MNLSLNLILCFGAREIKTRQIEPSNLISLLCESCLKFSLSTQRLSVSQPSNLVTAEDLVKTLAVVSDNPVDGVEFELYFGSINVCFVTCSRTDPQKLFSWSVKKLFLWSVKNSSFWNSNIFKVGTGFGTGSSRNQEVKMTIVFIVETDLAVFVA